MGKATYRDSTRVFEVLAAHLSSKRVELSIAVEHGRGIEGWLQHEALVALDNAYHASLAGRLASFTREGLRHHESATYEDGARVRPFDLVFDEPAMAACIKIYMPWKPITEAVRELQRDMIELLEHPDHGFLIAGRLDYEDGLGTSGGVRRGASGQEWLREAVRSAQDNMRLRPLVDEEHVEFESLHMTLSPLPWWGGQPDSTHRTPVLALGAWQVMRPTR